MPSLPAPPVATNPSHQPVASPTGKKLVVFALLAAAGLLLGCTSASPSDETGLGSSSSALINEPGASDSLIATLPNATSAQTAMEFLPDGRLLVCDKGGTIYLVKNNVLQATPFGSIPVDQGGERGLLGIAVDPNFSSNQRFYLHYSVPGGSRGRVSRFTASGDSFAASTEVVLLETSPYTSANQHAGGAVHVAGDGSILVAIGDAETPNLSQDLTSSHGKMLRVNADGTIPANNPYAGDANAVKRAIYASGLRNPYTFAVQPGTGLTYIDDVGADAYEEVDELVAGGNYGWPITGDRPTVDARFKSPVLSYQHGDGETRGCSIIGGTFYNPTNATFPAQYRGKFLFTDYCNGWVRSLDPATKDVTTFATGLGTELIDMKVNPLDGRLYYLKLDGAAANSVRAIGFAPSAPSIAQQPADLKVVQGEPATFSCAVNGTQPLSIKWQRGTTDIAGATSSSYTFTPALADSGAQFRCVASNSVQSGVTSSAATLTVFNSATQHRPVPVISAPAAGSIYVAGQTVNFTGSATDTEDGALPASRFVWDLKFHHDQHVHPATLNTPATGVTSGNFTPTNRGETSTNVWYEIVLSVTDSAGLSQTVTRRVDPKVVNLTLNTTPAGLKVSVDGTPTVTPATFASVQGLIRTLGTQPGQAAPNFQVYNFTSWSDAGAATHDIATPAGATTYTATYTAGNSPTGLSAQYFTNTTFTGTPVATRVDPAINFDWGTGNAFNSGLSGDNWSARWTGKLTVPFSEAYTFSAWSDDGIRMWVNNVQVLNDFTAHAIRETVGAPLALTASVQYDVKIEYFEATGGAQAKVAWQSASQPKDWIPTTALLPGSSCVPACSGKACGSDGCGGSCGTCGAGLTCTSNQCVSSGGCTDVALSRVSASASSLVGTNGAALAIDASTGTRWESASADPQSITIDLGQNRYVGRVVLDWETASAKDYVIELSTDNATWSVAKTVSNASSLNHRIDSWTGLSGSLVARYVRMRGTTRTTQYGYSLWDFAVYGDNNPSCSSSCVPSCTGKACGSDGCSGTCGTCGAGLTCSANQCVSSCVPSCTGKACGSDGCSGTCGTCGAGLTCSANQCVSSGACTDVALTRATASASSLVGTNTALKAIDASTGTRWESASADPQSITIDLGQNRYVGRVVLDWETASAKDYVIELSTDNATWSVAKTVSNATSLNHRIDNWTGLSGSLVARYVRMRGTTRTTQWGYSLWDFAVYGDVNPSCGP